MIKQRNWLTLSLAVAALILSAIFYYTSRPSENLDSTRFPDKTNVRVFLPSAPSSQIVRYERFEDDGHRSHVSIIYANGLTEEIEFRGDGTAERSVQSYPDTGDGKPGIRSEAQFDKTGRYFVGHKVFRNDGTLERTGELQRDGRYVSTYFFEDGVSQNRVRYFSTDKKLLQEKRFRKDGSVLSATTLTERGDLSISLYNPEGARTASFQRSIVSGETGEIFTPDGKARIGLYNRTAWSNEEVYFDENENLTQRRTGFLGSETVMVFLPPSEKPAYQQVWRKRPAQPDRPAQSILSRVQEFDENGLSRAIEMSNDGTEPVQVIYYKKGGREVRHLSKDLTVLKVERYEGSTLVSITIPATPMQESIDLTRLQEQPHPTLPTYSDENAPPMLYDYP